MLERTNRELIDTVEQVIKLQNEGAAARQQVEGRMEVMNQELRTSLIAFGSVERVAASLEPAASG